MKTKTQKASKIRVDFAKDGKDYYATFAVTREGEATTYSLHAEVFNSKNKLIFEKDRSGLDYSQVEHALTFVFHQAFVEHA